MAVKLLASALMLALVYWAWQAAGPLLLAKLHVGVWALIGGAVLLCSAGYAAILRSRTLISPTQICQRGLWTQRVDLATVSHAKLFHIPALAWLIAPRLMLRVRGRGVYTFFVAEPAVLDMIQRLGLGQSGPVD
jgi:hypothetical protein